MKQLLITLLFATLLLGCNEQNAIQPELKGYYNAAPKASTQEQDIPCVLTNIPIWVGQHTQMGSVNIYPSSEGVTFDFANLPNNVRKVHIKVSDHQLNGNLAPGQFPIDITPPLDQTYYYSFADLGIDPNCNLYYYIHFEVGNETGWAGNVKRTGRGQWYYWSQKSCCN